MLLKFRFSNFRPFRTEQELSLIASRLAGSDNGLCSPPGLGEQVLPVAAIYGANASGKTAVIKAFAFLANLVRFSQTQWQPDRRIPVEPFAGNDPALPSEFSVDFLLAGIRHQYGFAANSQAILREWAHIDFLGLTNACRTRAFGPTLTWFAAKHPLGHQEAVEIEASALVSKK